MFGSLRSVRNGFEVQQADDCYCRLTQQRRTIAVRGDAGDEMPLVAREFCFDCDSAGVYQLESLCFDPADFRGEWGLLRTAEGGVVVFAPSVGIVGVVLFSSKLTASTPESPNTADVFTEAAVGSSDGDTSSQQPLGGSCPAGHDLVGHRSTTWLCDGCDTHDDVTHMSMACRRCDYDICHSCLSRSSRRHRRQNSEDSFLRVAGSRGESWCLQDSPAEGQPGAKSCQAGHTLLAYYSATWICDECDSHDYSTHMAMACRLCNYDICLKCFDLMCSAAAATRPPPTGPTDTIADPASLQVPQGLLAVTTQEVFEHPSRSILLARGLIVELVTVSLHPLWRGRGVATAMIEFVLHEVIPVAFGRGAVVALHVRASNSKAILLYERCGFHRVALVPSYYSASQAATHSVEGGMPRREDAIYMAINF
jgi:ribosomal protein S18 acetylase RimI-like enzyme